MGSVVSGRAHDIHSHVAAKTVRVPLVDVSSRSALTGSFFEVSPDLHLQVAHDGRQGCSERRAFRGLRSHLPSVLSGFVALALVVVQPSEFGRRARHVRGRLADWKIGDIPLHVSMFRSRLAEAA